MSSVTVKEERQDEAEIRELAAKLLEANRNKVAQAAVRTPTAGSITLANYFPRKTDTRRQKETSSSEEKAPDEDSVCGKFGWLSLGKCHIPYIFRSGEKYCAVRMAEMKLLNKYLNYLHQDIYSCTCIRSYYITEAESRLLNEINIRHCDHQFGRDMFTTRDLIVRLNDAQEFFNFLDVCYSKLIQGSCNPKDRCGFIRINKESVVPYTIKEDNKYVPLFYFEGETDNLKLKADKLEGWDLSYLKFCCKVQGIRNELFAHDSCAVISLNAIKSYFPPGTGFEDYWPSKVVDSQLLVNGKNSVQVGQWTRQPPTPPAVTKCPTKLNSPLQQSNLPLFGGFTSLPSGTPTFQSLASASQNTAIRMAHSPVRTPFQGPSPASPRPAQRHQFFPPPPMANQAPPPPLVRSSPAPHTTGANSTHNELAILSPDTSNDTSSSIIILDSATDSSDLNSPLHITPRFSDKFWSSLGDGRTSAPSRSMRSPALTSSSSSSTIACDLEEVGTWRRVRKEPTPYTRLYSPSGLQDGRSPRSRTNSPVPSTGNAREYSLISREYSVISREEESLSSYKMHHMPPVHTPNQVFNYAVQETTASTPVFPTSNRSGYNFPGYSTGQENISYGTSGYKEEKYSPQEWHSLPVCHSPIIPAPPVKHDLPEPTNKRKKSQRPRKLPKSNANLKTKCASSSSIVNVEKDLLLFKQRQLAKQQLAQQQLAQQQLAQQQIAQQQIAQQQISQQQIAQQQLSQQQLVQQQLAQQQLAQQQLSQQQLSQQQFTPYSPRKLLESNANRQTKFASGSRVINVEKGFLLFQQRQLAKQQLAKQQLAEQQLAQQQLAQQYHLPESPVGQDYPLVQLPLKQEYPFMPSRVEQGYPYIQPPIEQGYPLINPPPEQGCQLLQRPVEQDNGILQPPVAQAFPLRQPLVEQGYRLLQPPFQPGYPVLQPQQGYSIVPPPVEQGYPLLDTSFALKQLPPLNSFAKLPVAPQQANNDAHLFNTNESSQTSHIPSQETFQDDSIYLDEGIHSPSESYNQAMTADLRDDLSPHANNATLLPSFSSITATHSNETHNELNPYVDEGLAVDYLDELTADFEENLHRFFGDFVPQPSEFYGQFNTPINEGLLTTVQNEGIPSSLSQYDLNLLKRDDDMAEFLYLGNGTPTTSIDGIDRAERRSLEFVSGGYHIRPQDRDANYNTSRPTTSKAQQPQPQTSTSRSASGRMAEGPYSRNNMHATVGPPSPQQNLMMIRDVNGVTRITSFPVTTRPIDTLPQRYPPPLIPVRGMPGTRSYMFPNPSEVVDLSPTPQMTQRQIHSTIATNNDDSNSHLTISANGRNVEIGKKLTLIAEGPTLGNHIPYKLQKALVDSKMLPCINMKPYICTELLITLPDIIQHFFPSVSLSSCRRVMDVLGIELYRGNRQQMQILHENGKCQSPNENLPLVQVHDVIKFMPQMKYMLSSMLGTGTTEPPISKRQRTS